jgi:hypothetical protein
MRSSLMRVGSAILLVACGSRAPSEIGDFAPSLDVGPGATRDLSSANVARRPADPTTSRASAAHFAAKMGRFDRAVVGRMQLSPEKRTSLLSILQQYRATRARLAVEMREHPELEDEEIAARPEFARADLADKNARIRAVLSKHEFQAYIELLDHRRDWLPSIDELQEFDIAHAVESTPAAVLRGGVQ